MEENYRRYKEVNHSILQMASQDQFQVIQRKQRLQEFSEKLRPRVLEHLEWEALVNELSGCWEPALGDAFPHQIIQFDRQSPAAGFAGIP